jgi:hypothetical protein
MGSGQPDGHTPIPEPPTVYRLSSIVYPQPHQNDAAMIP